VGPFNSLKVFC